MIDETTSVYATLGSAEPGSGSTTLEVRWIHRGDLPEAMLTWLGPFRDQVEEREDRYLIEPSTSELGVKIKGGVQLDLKALRGSPGELVLPGGVRGRLELWEKWSFPLRADAIPAPGTSTWLALEKVRHRRSFRVVGAGIEERPISEAELPGCTLELTEVTVDDERWWTLGLEAWGDPEELARTLRTTAEALLVGAVPHGVPLGIAESTSYARWLGTRRLGSPGFG